jgi:hypothetical protein
MTLLRSLFYQQKEPLALFPFPRFYSKDFPLATEHSLAAAAARHTARMLGDDHKEFHFRVRLGRHFEDLPTASISIYAKMLQYA